MSYHRGRWSRGLFDIVARVVLAVVVLGLLFGELAVPIVAEVVGLVGDALVALAERVAQ